MDFVVQTEKLPLPGETVKGRDFSMIPGGKGANQAVAAARLGGRVCMAGRVGRDGFGRTLTEGLSSAGVDAGRVLPTSGVATGVALILVEREGQNQITIAAGANDRLEAADLEPAFQDLQPGSRPAATGVAPADGGGRRPPSPRTRGDHHSGSRPGSRPAPNPVAPPGLPDSQRDRGAAVAGRAARRGPPGRGPGPGPPPCWSWDRKRWSSSWETRAPGWRTAA